jgi:hypothetical protein
MIKELAQAVVIAVPTALCISALFYQPTPEMEAQRQEKLRLDRLEEDRIVSVKVQECLEAKGPWKCYVSLKEEDESSPVKRGASRLTRLATLTQAKEVLRFCDLPRKVDCANEMFGAGFKAVDIQGALASVDEIVAVSGEP